LKQVSPALGERRLRRDNKFPASGFEGDVSRIWDSNIFGKPFYDMPERGSPPK
jgi:hypothetical protein